MEKIKIIALMGEAGSGKDTLLRCIMSSFPKYNEIVSCTTRPKRMGEIEGRSYYFMTDEMFQTIVKSDAMLEYTSFNGWYYGTALSSLNPNKINVGIFNPEGIRKLLAREDLDVRVYYVRASAKTRVIRQLNREDNPDVDEVFRRYGTDREDFSKINFAYENIPNESVADLDAALSRIHWVD